MQCHLFSELLLSPTKCFARSNKTMKVQVPNGKSYFKKGGLEKNNDAINTFKSLRGCFENTVPNGPDSQLQ